MNAVQLHQTKNYEINEELSAYEITIQSNDQDYKKTRYVFLAESFSDAVKASKEFFEDYHTEKNIDLSVIGCIEINVLAIVATSQNKET